MIMLQQGKNTQWCSRDKARKTDSHTPHIDRMETIHVLAIVNSHNNLLLIDMLWQRKLNNEAINVFILIQLIHTSQKLFFCHISLKTNERRLESTLLTSNYLILNIGFTSAIMSHQNGSQMRLFTTCGNNRLHFFGNLLLYSSCSCLSVY